MSATPSRINPFPGLRPFTQEEDYLFFGREEQTLELLQRLGSNRFVAVVGTSGSGKSSLVRCGLLSELLGGRMLGAGSLWEIAVTHPGGNPLALLTDSLLEADLYDRDEEDVRENLLATLNRSHFGLVEAIRQADLGDATNFLLVVDQFEEIFRFQDAGQRQEEVANEFISLLLEAASQTAVPIYVVLTMRSDFIGECGQFEGLAEMVNRGEFLIPRLTREQYKRVIEGPIKVAGGQVAPRLLQRLLNDLGQQADQLPCLQHALMRTWNVWAQKKEPGLIDRDGPESAAHQSGLTAFSGLDLDDYHRVGMMSQALSLHADEIYESLADDLQRELCQGIFQALTVEESNSRGIRRPQRLGRLCQILEVPAEELIPIIDAYRHSGVTFLMPSPEVKLTEQTIIDVSHESLMRVWTRLRQWVEEETQAAGIYHRLSESAELHSAGKAGLYRDPELGIALAWRNSKRPNAAWAERYRPGFETAIRFLDASQQASIADEQARETARQRELNQAQDLAEAQRLRLDLQQRSARKLRMMISGLAVVAIMAGIASVAAMRATRQANELKLIAADRAELAQQSADQAKRSAADAVRLRIAAEQSRHAMEKTAAQASAQKVVAQRESYRSTIRLAESMLQGDDNARFRVSGVLWDTDPALRSWEWGHLMAQCPLEDWSFQTDKSGVKVCTASTDGRLLVTAGTNGRVTLWDLQSRRQMWQFDAGPVHRLAVDPRNHFAAIGSLDESLPAYRLLDLTTGKLLHQADRSGAADVAFSRQGDRLFVLNRVGELRSIDTSSGKEMAQTHVAGLPGSPALRTEIWGSALSYNVLFADTQRDYVGIFSSFADPPNPSKFRFFDAMTLNTTSHLDGLHQQVTNIGSPSTPILRSALGEVTYSFTTAVFRKTTDGVQTLICDHSDYVNHLAVDPITGTVVSATANGEVNIVQAEDQKHTVLHGSPIAGLAILSGGRFITTGADGLVKCWNLTPPTPLAFKNPAPVLGSASANFVDFTSDGRNFLYRAWDRVNGLYDVNSLEFRSFRYPDRTGNVNLFPMFRPETNELVDYSNDGLLFFPLTSSGVTTESSRSILIPMPSSAAFDAAGRMLVVSSEKQAAVFDLETDEQLPRPEVAGSGWVSINRSGTRAVLRTAAGIQVWDTFTGRLINSIDSLDDGATDTRPRVIFHPDGELIAVVEAEAGLPSKLIVWNSTDGSMHSDMEAATGTSFGICRFSDDGQRLLVRCSDNKIRIFDWQLGKELMALSGGTNLDVFAMSPDGLAIVYAGHNPVLFVAKSLPWQAEMPGGAVFNQAVDDLRLFTASTARSAVKYQGPTVVLTNRSEKSIRVDYVIGSQRRTLQELKPGETRDSDTSIPKGVRFEFIDPESSKQLESFSFAPVAHNDDEGPVGIKISIPDSQAVEFSTAELLGDIAYRQARMADAKTEYATAITHHRKLVLEDPSKAAPQGRLAIIVQKQLAVLAEIEPDRQVELLQQTVDFWNTLVQSHGPNPSGWQHLLSFQRHLLDHQISKDKVQAKESLLTFLSLWADQIAKTPDDRILRYGASELCQRLPGTFPVAADAAPIDQLIIDYPKLAVEIADAYSAVEDWESVIAVCSRRISTETANSELLSRRGRAHEQLQNWSAAAADWQRFAANEPDGGMQLIPFIDRLLNAEQLELAETVSTHTRSLLEQHLDSEHPQPQIVLALVDLLLSSLDTAPRTLLPTSESDGVEWLTTSTQPSDAWMKEDFDDSGWEKQPGGWGRKSTSGPVVRSEWATSDIWLRRTFEWQPSSTDASLMLRLIHDDDVEVFINGQSVASVAGWTPTYITHPLNLQAVKVLHAGTNTIAVHCRQFSGGQHIDAGLLQIPLAVNLLNQYSAAQTLTDPWEKLAAAYQLLGDQPALDRLLIRHPAAAVSIGDRFAAEQKWDQAIAAYSGLITEQTTDASLFIKRAEAYFATAQWDLARADVRRAVTQQPNLAQSEFDRYRTAQRWNEAAEYGVLLIEQKPEDTMLWVRVPPVAALSHDEQSYRRVCQHIMDLFMKSPTPENADRAIKGCLLRGGTIEIADLPLDRISMSLDEATAPAWLPAWFWGARALLAYRRGDAEGAVTYVTQSEAKAPSDHAHALNLAVLAMAQHDQKNVAAARATLEAAAQIITKLQAADRNHHDFLIAEILFHEAEDLMKGGQETKESDGNEK